MEKRRYRKGIFIVVYRKEKNKKGEEIIQYLLLKRKLHWKGWEFCKGGVEKRETYRKALLREIKEEIGLKVIKINWYCKKGKYKYDKLLKDRPNIIGQTYILTSCEVNRGKVKISKKEHSAYKWLNYKKALEKLKHKNQKDCLKLVNKRVGK